MQGFVDALRMAIDETAENLGAIVGGIPRLIAAILVIVLFALLARFISQLVSRSGKISGLDPNLSALIHSLVSASIVIFGVAVGLGVLGLGLRTLLASFGVVGLIVGFALKDMLENFVAGILVLWRRPFRIGDQIRVGTHEGIVRDINFRMTALQAPDGVEVLIPNAQVFAQAVYNLTRYGARRSSVTLNVPDGVEIEDARRTLEEIANRIDGVLPQPPPQVLLLDTDELHLRYWTTPDIEQAAEIESAVRQAATTALKGMMPPEQPASSDSS